MADIDIDPVELLDDRQAYQQMAHAVNPYGDGQAARRICSAIADYFK